ncbi:MAG: hypothetical protein KY469_20705 [Actinobacteria bacterium]|nr:hypothetical protein [Actinomycetota bacterium]
MTVASPAIRLRNALGRDTGPAMRVATAAAIAVLGVGAGLVAYRWFLARMIDVGWVALQAEGGRVWRSFEPFGASPWSLVLVGGVALAALAGRGGHLGRSLALAALVLGIVFLGWSEVQHHWLGWIDVTEGGWRFWRDQLFHAPGFVLVLGGWTLARRAVEDQRD